jgi:hypothetical protein
MVGKFINLSTIELSSSVIATLKGCEGVGVLFNEFKRNSSATKYHLSFLRLVIYTIYLIYLFITNAFTFKIIPIFIIVTTSFFIILIL